MKINKLISFLLLFTASFSCKKAPEKIHPTRETITESVYASGTVRSKNQYQVYATATGIVDRVFVKEGDLVQKGDPILAIRNESARLNVENAQLLRDYSDWNAQGAKLEDLKSAHALARLRLQEDSILYVRQAGLWNQGIGSALELEQRVLAFKSAQSTEQSARLRLQDLQKQLDFSAAQAKKQLAISRQFAQDFIVRSEIKGKIYSLNKLEGELVGPQLPLAVVGDATQFVVSMQIDEVDIMRMQLGLRVLLSLDSYKGQVFKAKISKIDPIMNERTRTFTVEADFDAPPPLLFPNLNVEANIVLNTRENALTIPRDYLFQDSLVLLEDKSVRSIRVGMKDYRKVEVLHGLNEQENLLMPVK